MIQNADELFCYVDSVSGHYTKERTYCYFISDGKFVKVGVSNNPEFRLTRLQCGNAKKLRLIGWVGTNYRDVAETLEKTLHFLFKDLRKSGEWFDCMDDPLMMSILSHEYFREYKEK